MRGIEGREARSRRSIEDDEETLPPTQRCHNVRYEVGRNSKVEKKIELIDDEEDQSRKQLKESKMNKRKVADYDEDSETEYAKKFAETFQSDNSDTPDDPDDVEITEKDLAGSSSDDDVLEWPWARNNKSNTRKPLKLLPVHHKPPQPWPKEMTQTYKREIVYFQRKMRAFRNLKNHILTVRRSELEEEAEKRGWGPIPEYLKKKRPEHLLTHVEVLYHFWPQPFEEVERLWLSRHIAEFKECWAVDKEDVVKSEILTPYMKFIRCYPHKELLQIRRIEPPSELPTKRQLGIPITGEHLIIDAKAVLTYYGVHRLKEWEVHDNIDYGIMDFQILLEELREAAKPIIERLRDEKVRKLTKKRRLRDADDELSE